jgi:hypothetical protein
MAGRVFFHCSSRVAALALHPCRECGAQISSEATACPHCGAPAKPPPVVAKAAPVAAPPKKRRVGFWLLLLISAFIVYLANRSATDEGQDNSTSAAGTPASPNDSRQPAPQPAAASPAVATDDGCHDDWKKCTDNAELANKYGNYIHVQSMCQQEANHEAKSGTPVWPGFWSGGPFSRFHTGNEYVTTGIVVLIEPDAQFSNGFGAMVHSTVTCTYDPNNDAVRSVDVAPNG